MNPRTKEMVLNRYQDSLTRLDQVVAARPWMRDDQVLWDAVAETGKTGGILFGFDALQSIELLADRITKDAHAARTDRERNTLHAKAVGVTLAAEVLESFLWDTSRV